MTEKIVFDIKFTCFRCRRSYIAKHFDEEWNAKQCDFKCDHCLLAPETFTINIRREYRQLLRIIDYCAEVHSKNVTALCLMDTWYSTYQTKKFRPPDVAKAACIREVGEIILAYLVVNDYFKEKIHYTAYTTISYIVKGNLKIS